MSEYFTGITFPQQRVTPSYDAVIRKAVLSDGILSGCELSYSGSTLTMGAGLMIACGRQFHHTSVQNWAVTGAASGYARLLLTIDTTRASSKENFDQILSSIEYASSINGFPDLQQTDINQSGAIYQLPVCVVSLGAGGITGIVSSVGNAAAANYVNVTLTAAGWTASEEAGFVQPVTIAGMTDNKKVRVYPAIPETLADKLALAEEMQKIKSSTRTGNTMTFEAWEEAPALDVPIIVEVVT